MSGPDIESRISHDFDFFFGEWEVTHRRLTRRLVGDTNWQEFTGVIRMKPILHGLGNLDESVMEIPGQDPYPVGTLRLFNPNDGLWRIYWMDGREPVLDVPMVGTFEDGVGTFYADETFEGRPIRVRFLWIATDPEHPRWEQAFSVDEGETWETNWIMTYVKLAPTA